MNRVMRNVEGTLRPPLVLTRRDRNRLLVLLHGAATTTDSEVVRFLGEEIARAEVAPDDVAPNSVVSMGSKVKFIDHAATRIRHAKLAFPEEASEPHCISILSPTGSALIGLGPGQSIQWIEQGSLRSLTVLEVRASAPPSPGSTSS
jgi:regulator of nucleoside diphosphate kinase